MIINTEWCGDPIAYYDDINVRTGASSLEDSDFENYPPFVYCDFKGSAGDPEISRTTFRSAVNYKHWTPDIPEYNDMSFAYCGIKNPNLPQCCIGAYGQTPDAPSGESYDRCFQTDPNEIKPVYFLSDKRKSQFSGSNYSSVADNSFLNPLDIYQGHPRNGAYYWNPNFYDVPDYDSSIGYKYRNITLDMAPWRSFGIRSIFGVIYVKYFSITNELHGTRHIPSTTHISTLHYYETQTDEWKTDNHIVAAWLRIFYRSNTNGTYSTWGTTMKNSFACDILYGLRINPNIITNVDYETSRVISPAQAISDDSVDIDLPLLGLRNHGTTSSFGTNSNGGMSVGNYPCFIGWDFGLIEHGESTAQYRRTLWFHRAWTSDEADCELLRKAAAAYGLFFTDGDSSDSGYADLFAAGHDEDRWYNGKMCLGVIDGNGHTDGTYTRGIQNVTAPQWGWSDSTQSPYDPSLPPDDPIHYNVETEFNLLGGIASCNKMYAVQATSIMNLARALSTAISLRGADVPPLDYSLETFLTNNPLDCIITLRYYPTTAITTGTEEPIAFGSYSNASVTGIPFVGSFKKLDFNFSVSARNALYPHFGDFRDYEPYTHAELIVPFCGTVPINPCDFIGHDINVHMIVDYITGSCTAYIAADGLVVTSIAGQIGIDVPLSGIQQATLDGQRVNAVLNRQSAELNATNAAVGGLTSAIGFAGSLAGDNIVGAIGSGAGVVGSINRFQQADISYHKADYELKHMQVPFKTVSAGSPVASTVIESCCRLIIYRPVMDDRYNDEIYAQTVGFACLMNGSVGQFTGLTVGNINTDGLNVTESEKQMIQKAFANGVII